MNVTREELRTSFRVVGVDRVDEFESMCLALDLRPHELVGRLVSEGLVRYRRADPDLVSAVRVLCEARRPHGSENGVDAADASCRRSPDEAVRRGHLRSVR